MPTDEEIFAMRDAERRRKQEQRDTQKTLRVHEKTTWTTRVNAVKLHSRDGDEESMADPEEAGGLRLPLINDPSTNGRRREKENLTDFINKKREMFLVQMSIDIKRDEIRKLEEKAKKREDILTESEKMLEADSQRFEKFLKESDDRAMKAMKKAESETKAKTEKMQEIKRLKLQIESITSEMTKIKEQLEESSKYKRFLDKLTPANYIKEQTELKQQRADERRKRRELKLKRTQKQAVKETGGPRRENVQAADRRGALRRRSVMPVPGGVDKRRASVAINAPTAASAVAAQLTSAVPGVAEPLPGHQDSDSDESSDDELPMYFVDPKQLLDIFAQLEESNLFLIRNCQEAEESLEELKAKYEETRARMSDRTEGLDAQISALEAAIAEEEDKASGMQSRTSKNGMLTGQEEILTQLNEKVSQVYSKSGFDNDAKIGTVEMLTNIEKKLEDLFGDIAELDRDDVARAEHSKEMERREAARVSLMEKKKREQEERVQKALERAREPAFKRTGKPVMFRSVPNRRKKQEQAQKTAQEAEDEADIRELFTA
eukprot:TRINITY_DN5850_c0_g2_i1.p1 TRINITY_DN5850_c0_g2~~TRINITY_DN5850_c0_g2_i1.p1  ORF type:complete len:569 (-),score=170.89 TRINITY_DN5850_c0_g2_i1:95-1738(-)